MILSAIILVSAFAGFSFRKYQITRSRLRVSLLEREIINNHAEILELQKEFISMELKFRGIKDPVVVMKNIAKIESIEKIPDASTRRKLLNKETTPSRNEGYQMIYDNLLTKEAQVQY
jgi:hypothetical protein